MAEKTVTNRDAYCLVDRKQSQEGSRVAGSMINHSGTFSNWLYLIMVSVMESMKG